MVSRNCSKITKKKSLHELKEKEKKKGYVLESEKVDQ